MHIQMRPGPSLPGLLQQLPPLSEETGPDTAHESPPGNSARAEHDATLLVAALEELAARRAAIEWLVQADLLCRCLV